MNSPLVLENKEVVEGRKWGERGKVAEDWFRWSLTWRVSKTTSLYLSVFPGSCSCFSVSQSCPALHNPVECSTPGLPVPHHFPEFAQVDVHSINYAIQPSHPLMPSSPPGREDTFFLRRELEKGTLNPVEAGRTNDWVRMLSFTLYTHVDR